MAAERLSFSNAEDLSEQRGWTPRSHRATPKCRTQRRKRAMCEVRQHTRPDARARAPAVREEPKKRAPFGARGSRSTLERLDGIIVLRRFGVRIVFGLVAARLAD